MQSLRSKRVMCLAWLWVTGLIVLVDGAVLRADDAVSMKPVYLPAPTAIEQDLRAMFDEQTDLAFSEVPLRDAMEFLQDLHKVNFILDVATLQDEGIDESTPITIEITGVTLRSAMRLVLEPLGLTWIIRDEVILITTRTKVDQQFLTRIYPVADLAESAEELEVLARTIEQSTNGRWVKLLPQTMPPMSGGSISEVPRVRSLVVKQSLPVHEEIVALLVQLREAQTLLQRDQGVLPPQ